MKKSIIIILSIIILIVGTGAVLLNKYGRDLPSIQEIETYQPSIVSRIYDINNKVISEVYLEKRIIVPLTQIPLYLQKGIIAVEDKRFFWHWGIDLYGIFRAFFKNLINLKVVEGGSTITQQLAKLMFLTPERNLERKIKEFVLALYLEVNYTKEEILEMYLNQVYFGNGAYGVESAAQIYFNKSANNLNLAECALLAGLPRSPANYSPFSHPEAARARQELVLNLLEQQEYITPQEKQNALQQVLPTERFKSSPKYGDYFTNYVLREVEKKYGSEAIYKQGLNIYTTVDFEMQKYAEQSMENQLKWIDEVNKQRFEVLEETTTDQGNLTSQVSTQPVKEVQGAMLVLDPSTGQIRAWVGGRNFRKSQFDRVYQAKRQPGSAFKPFIYTAALDNGWTLADVIEDTPVTYYYDGNRWKLLSETTNLANIDPQFLEKLPPDRIWQPTNYEENYQGTVTLCDALAYSINVCAVKLLAQIGPKRAIEYANKMGIESPLINSLSLALGSSEVSLLELTAAFCPISNGGTKIRPYGVVKIVDNEGNILEENFPAQSVVLNPQTAYLTNFALQQAAERGTAWYTKYINRPRAGKTGTSNDFTDAWFVGYVPGLIAGVWVGYDDNTSLGKKMAGAGVAVPIWTEFMKNALRGKPITNFEVPEDIVFYKVDPHTGLLALENNPDAILLPFIKGTEPKEYAF